MFSKKSIESNLEGFWAGEKCSHLWTWEEGEIDRLLNTENEKNWWQQRIKNNGGNPAITKDSNSNKLWSKLKSLWS